MHHPAVPRSSVSSSPSSLSSLPRKHRPDLPPSPDPDPPPSPRSAAGRSLRRRPPPNPPRKPKPNSQISLCSSSPVTPPIAAASSSTADRPPPHRRPLLHKRTAGLWPLPHPDLRSPPRRRSSHPLPFPSARLPWPRSSTGGGGIWIRGGRSFLPQPCVGRGSSEGRPLLPPSHGGAPPSLAPTPSHA